MGLANTLGFNRLLVLVTKFRFQLANQIWKLRRPGKQGWCEARKLQVVLEQGSYCLDHIKWKGVLYYYQSIPKPIEVLGHQRAWYLVIWHDDVYLVDIRMFWNIIQGWFVIWWADLMLQSIDEVWSWKDLVILHLLSLISLSVCMAVTGVSPEWYNMQRFDMIWIGMACWDVIYANQTLHYPAILLCNIDLFSFFLLFIIFFGLTVPTFLTQHREGDLFSRLRWGCREPTRLWTLGWRPAMHQARKPPQTLDVGAVPRFQKHHRPPHHRQHSICGVFGCSDPS